MTALLTGLLAEVIRMSKQATITEKRCTRCEITKPVEDFYRIGRSHCKECERTEAAERMRRYNGTFRGKASQALQTTKKAVRRLESEGIEVVNTLTIHEVALTLGEDTCAYCGEEIPEQERTLDHIVPMKYGGGNTFENITMACSTCNSVKNDLPLVTYMVREQTEAEIVLKLFEHMATRGKKTFDEIFEQMAEDARTYYAIKTEEAIEKARQQAEEGQTGEGEEMTS